MFRTYYQLAKPGIVRGNVLTGIAGFLLGVHLVSNASVAAIIPFPIAALLGFSVGLALSIAGACVFNNVMDQDIDALMARTKKRALITGEVTGQQAVLYGAILTALGLVVLIYTSLLAALLTLIGVLVYLGAYTPAKRTTVHSTLIGAVAGAVPPVAGYAASTGRLDVVALALFFCLASWQMPHFFAIALFRAKEYAAASLPIMSVAHGAVRTRALIIVYILVFIFSSMVLGFLATLPPLYFLSMGILGSLWLILAIAGLYARNANQSARRIFHFSLIILLVWSALISFA